MARFVEKKVGGNVSRGRPKGSLNKVTRLLKEQILEAAASAHPEGVVGYLRDQAECNPKAFMALLGKVLPSEMRHSGSDGGPVCILSRPMTAEEWAAQYESE